MASTTFERKYGIERARQFLGHHASTVYVYNYDTGIEVLDVFALTVGDESVIEDREAAKQTLDKRAWAVEAWMLGKEHLLESLDIVNGRRKLMRSPKQAGGWFLCRRLQH